MVKTYLPNEQSYSSGLPEGKSNFTNKANIGRTHRERKKQADRFNRIRKRSADDLANQKKVK